MVLDTFDNISNTCVSCLSGQGLKWLPEQMGGSDNNEKGTAKHTADENNNEKHTAKRRKYPCEVDGCSTGVFKNGKCYNHLPDADKPKCEVDGCSKGVFMYGKCYKHLSDADKPKCMVVGCSNFVRKAGKCHKHQPDFLAKAAAKADAKAKAKAEAEAKAKAEAKARAKARAEAKEAAQAAKAKARAEAKAAKLDAQVAKSNAIAEAWAVAQAAKAKARAAKVEAQIVKAKARAEAKAAKVEAQVAKSKAIAEAKAAKAKARAEAKATAQATKRKFTTENDPNYWPFLSTTNTSQYCQDRPELPRQSIQKVAFSSNQHQQPVKSNRVEMLMPTNQKVEKQLKECTVSMCIDDNPNSPKCTGVRNLFEQIFRQSKKNSYYVHSLYHHIHANRYTTELPESYKQVDGILGMMTKSSSVFRCNLEKNNRPTNASIVKPNTNVFLARHMDSHSLPTLFLSLSGEDSYVYYSRNNEDVGKLLIPKGLSVVYTTEIHTGSKLLNPEKLTHYSTSATDRFLFRIVHETAGDKPFNLLQPELVENLMKAMKIIYL